MTLDPQSVIVYRSKFEQIQDEFWSSHPEYILAGIGLVILLYLGFQSADWIAHYRSRRRARKFSRRSL